MRCGDHLNGFVYEPSLPVLVATCTASNDVSVKPGTAWSGVSNSGRDVVYRALTRE